jgi:hypothetical protein
MVRKGSTVRVRARALVDRPWFPGLRRGVDPLLSACPFPTAVEGPGDSRMSGSLHERTAAVAFRAAVRRAESTIRLLDRRRGVIEDPGRVESPSRVNRQDAWWFGPALSAGGGGQRAAASTRSPTAAAHHCAGDAELAHLAEYSRKRLVPTLGGLYFPASATWPARHLCGCRNAHLLRSRVDELSCQRARSRSPRHYG